MNNIWKYGSGPVCGGKKEFDAPHKITSITLLEDTLKNRKEYVCSYCGIKIYEQFEPNGSSCFYYHD